MDFKHFGLYTDYYELSMIQGYFFNGKGHEEATFDYFFRKNPFGGAYTVFAGMSDLLAALESLSFDIEDLAYLKSLGFKASFLDFLADFQFRGDLFSVREGEIVFPNEPLLSVRASLIEAQLVETLVLNFLNYQSLIATKASRIRHVCGNRVFIDFGMRRAHGTGALMGSKAAIIGGANATSNVLSGFEYDLPVSGTMAHSWIQSFEDEYTAFRKFAELYPNNTILLVDTYDTLRSGVPNAIRLAKELLPSGFRLKGIRLDSGDLLALSKQARKILDESGLRDVMIIVSNQQDEYTIEKLLNAGAPIDGFGVGTNLIVGRPDAALDGVYKLSNIDGKPSIKLSDNPEKTTIPGKKGLGRYYDENGQMLFDIIFREDEEEPANWVPFAGKIESANKVDRFEPLLHRVMKNGKAVEKLPTAMDSSAYLQGRFQSLPDKYKKLFTNEEYGMTLSRSLFELRSKMIKQLSEEKE